jgi:hypothetical protein
MAKKAAVSKRNEAQGISNRESAEAEARERQQHPPVQEGTPPPEDASGRKGDEPFETAGNRQTSRKAGSRSTAQKEANARDPDSSVPAAGKVPGAFGREPDDDGKRRRP